MNKKFYLNEKNILYFILLIALLWRINNLFNPIIGDQSWRQADTAAMSRNYYENGFNFLYPQIDWGGNSKGYVESEFPIYQYAVAVLYELFGVHVSLGRILSIIFSLITIFFLYRIAAKYFDKKTALWTCFIYSILPLNVFYSRVFMGEPLLLMSITIGIYYYSEWLDKEKISFYFISLLFISLACLIKIPTLYIGLPLFYLSWKKYSKKVFKNVPILFYAIIVFLSVYLWYYHAHQIYLNSKLTFNIWGYGTDKWGNWGFITTWEYWNGVFFKNIAAKHLTWVGFIVFIFALVLFRKNKQMRFFYVWLIAGLIYLIIVARGNYFHDYYQLPVIIPISFFMGKIFSDYFKINLSNWRSKALIFSLAGIFILSAFRYIQYIKRENLEHSDKYKLAMLAKKIIPKDSLVITVSNYNPILLYLSETKGWRTSPRDINIDFIKDKINKGAKYLLLNQKNFVNADTVHLNNILHNFKDVSYNNGESLIIHLNKQLKD